MPTFNPLNGFVKSCASSDVGERVKSPRVAIWRYMYIEVGNDCVSQKRVSHCIRIDVGTSLDQLSIIFSPILHAPQPRYPIDQRERTNQEANANGEEATANPIVEGRVPCSIAYPMPVCPNFL